MKRSFFLAVALAAVICSTLIYLSPSRESQTALPPTGNETKLGDQLPALTLVDQNSNKIGTEELNTGKVVLIFFSPGCQTCSREEEFLRTVIGQRTDIKFYGVTSYANIEPSQKFAFKVLYDANGILGKSLGVRTIPFKIYIKDGRIKKACGATVSQTEKAEFVTWLEEG